MFSLNLKSRGDLRGWFNSIPFALLLSVPIFLSAQDPIPLEPYSTWDLNLSLKKEKKFKELCIECKSITDKFIDNPGYNLTKKEEKFLRKCGDEPEAYWLSSIADGCSWYCAGGPLSITASNQTEKDSISNVSDLDYSTIWKTDNAKGTKIDFTFNYYSPRITKIIATNGNIKNKKLWRKSGKIKHLEVAVEGKPVQILKLKKTRKEQYFQFSPLGNDPNNYIAENKNKTWTLSLKILETYGNTKSVEISDIQFDGIDIH